MRTLPAPCSSVRPLLALAAAAIGLHAFAGDLPESVPLSPHPGIAVASFGVAPVGALAGESDPARPRPGDVLYRRGEPLARSGQRAEVETRVLAGETWPQLLKRIGDNLDSEVLASGATGADVDLLPALAPGKFVRVRRVPASRAVEIDYVVEAEEAYAISLSPDGVHVRRQASDPRLVEQMRADPSKASLFTATDAIGLPEEIVLQLAEIFSSDVDFFRELHHGYRSTIVYEVLYREGHIDRAGRILAAEFVIRNRRLQAFYYDDGGSRRPGYYAETGMSMRKTFRKAPVEFSRITSDYTLARFHPILGLWRAHRGIDYAAPIGTRVLATADGVVEFMGERGAFGNLVILEHFGRYLTYYAHLDGFAGNLAVGAPVEQGEVIGFVGMTGLATGPHVHYEFHVRDASGEWTHVPPPDILEAPPIESPAFFAAIQDYRDKLAVAEKTHLVILD